MKFSTFIKLRCAIIGYLNPVKREITLAEKQNKKTTEYIITQMQLRRWYKWAEQR